MLSERVLMVPVYEPSSARVKVPIWAMVISCCCFQARDHRGLDGDPWAPQRPTRSLGPQRQRRMAGWAIMLPREECRRLAAGEEDRE
jgi:hypothetical protein